jgi:hypothetical protein
MGFDAAAYAAAKKYVDETAKGLGAVKGSPCTIKSITESDEGSTIVFAWTGADGVERTETTFLRRGPQGPKGDPGTGSVEVDATLTQAGKAADAKATGDRLTALTEEIVNVKPTAYTLDTSRFVPLDIDDFSEYKQPYHPKVLFFENGFAGYKYWMVQTPVPIGGQPYIDRWENPCVYRSNNGIQWGNAENANPLDGLTESEIKRMDYMSDPHLVWREDLKRLECWYRHTNRGSDDLPTAVLRKYTYDGVNWSEREVMIDYKTLHESDFHRSPAYIWDNEAGYYRAWYAPDSGVKYNTSVDGKTWGTQTDCVYIGGSSHTWHLDVEYIDGYYYLLSYDKDEGAKNVKCFRSVDGINFEFFKTILSPNEVMTDYYRSCSLKDEHGKIRVYFSTTTEGVHKLGVMVGDGFEHLAVCDGTKVINAKNDSPDAVDARHVFFDGVSLYDKIRELLGITVNAEPTDPEVEPELEGEGGTTEENLRIHIDSDLCTVENGVVKDLKNKCDFTLENVTVGDGFVFNGTNSRMVSTFDNIDVLLNHTFTAHFYVKCNDFSGTINPIAMANGGTLTSDAFVLTACNYKDGTSPYLTCGRPGGKWLPLDAITEKFVTDGYKLITIAANRTYNKVKLYIDGQLVQSYEGAPYTGTKPPLVLGNLNDHYFNGSIKIVKMYNKMQSAAEIRAEFNAIK